MRCLKHFIRDLHNARVTPSAPLSQRIAKLRNCSFFDSYLRPSHSGYGLVLFIFLIFLLPQGSFAFDLQGHRGARGLAPENTLTAFALALKTGVNTLELDVAMTADGVVMVSHDATLNPSITRDASGQWLAGTKDAKGPQISTLTLAQLQTYDVGRVHPDSAYARQFSSQQPQDGARIPTLAAVFELVKTRGADAVRFNIETKLSPLEPDATFSPEVMTRALLQVVREAGMASRVTIQSFDWRSLQLVQHLAPGMPTACLTAQFPGSDTLRDGRWTAGLRLADYASVPALVKAAACTAWSPNSGALTQALINQAHAMGVQVLPWTVNTPQDMAQLLDWQVDGIITDYPDRLRSVMQQRHLALPSALP